MKESPTETPEELRQQIRNLNRRALNFKFIIALYLVVMSLLTVVLNTGFNPMLRPLVLLLWIVGGVSLFLRSQIARDRSFAASPDNKRSSSIGLFRTTRPVDLPDQIRELVPEGAKKVYDLKDLPPEIAANPEVQKLMERVGAQGAWVKITRRDPSTGQEFQQPETVKIAGTFGEPGPPQVGKAEEMMAQGSPVPASISDVQKLAQYVESHGSLPADPEGMETLGAPLSTKLTSILSRIVIWASFIVIFAALAVAAVALWTLNSSPPPPH